MPALLAAVGANAQTGGPAETAAKYFAASQAWRCDEVWKLYTAGARENILEAERRYDRERNGEPRPDTPQKTHCGHRIGKLKPETVRILQQGADDATAAADFIVEVSRSRYDLFPAKGVATEKIQLVREAGAWRVDPPRLPVYSRPGWRLVEVGAVDVYQEGRVPNGFLRKLEATVVSRVPRPALEAALRDSVRWTRGLPSVASAQSLEPDGDRERVRLVFDAQPERSAVVSGNFGSDSRYWGAEGGNNAPVYFRGSFKLDPHYDGTRVTLVLVIDPRHWSGDAAEGVFSA